MILPPAWLMHSIILLALSAGSVTDLKKREVPDTISYGLMAAGITIGIIFSILNKSIWPVLSAISGLAVGYGFGALMFYTGQWGGGDAKMLMGLGAMQGLFIPIISASGIGSLFLGIPIFITTLATIFIAGAVYGILFTLILSLKHWNKFKKAFVKKIQEPEIIKRRTIITISTILLLLMIILTKILFFKLLLGILACSLFFGHYFMIIAKIAEEELMVKSMHVSAITEGEWIKKEVIVKGKLICGPKDKLGISKKQIEELRKHKIKTILVRQGIPFIPGFLIGYLIIILLGNWMNSLLLI